ncbi:PD40 domain-containing protein [Pseudoalteromonas luteoviolacea]|uniref:winged helix-turn-helix domain-containing protein n=1 Tax=Pseudoalteromonas luteoviolacea TaxID=43657 RepID=UPI001B3A050C|nr:winged helix-turn-helix domain-containing protein [Pseudoalteromonas luteoviolacea]MBQ4879124.1 PD40 domain-containing protein [Pseudoalteromonas luteoviolacea]MBQ4908121.1 PD40 domain-containing protein [Pseudoalteromonas luteoviolacea]
MSPTQRFYIQEHLIDLSRSEISYAEQSTKVEPKILQVLLLLAQNAPEVVSHQQIMDEVWKGSEVVPNALQRCIARLRKVLGDDAKSPHIIATHPKIGYRLMVDVQWLPENKTKFAAMQSSLSLKQALYFGLPCVLIIMLGLVTWWHTQPEALKVNSLKQLTYTDAFESEVTYSPDGQYIVFNRHTHSCQSHIWAKNLQTGIEKQLSVEPGFYRDTRFTPDGRNILYTKQRHCDQSKTTQHEPLQANCWQINMLNFATALNAPQVATVPYQCQANSITRPVALPNHQYAFLSRQGNTQTLIKFNALAQHTGTLFNLVSHSVYTYDYDPIHAQYAVLSFNQENQHILSILNKRGELLQQSEIDTSNQQLQVSQFSIRFSDHGNALLAVSHGKLYHLTLDGKVTAYQTALNDIVSAQSHPLTSKIIAIKGNKDTDIALIPFSGDLDVKTERVMNQSVQPYPSFARSKSREKYARFQPNGELIAFISARSGQDQIWLWDGVQEKQLTHFSQHSKIEQFSWSPDGQNLAVIHQTQLNMVNLNGETHIIEAPAPLVEVLNWHPQSGVFVTASHPSAHTLWQLDLDKQIFTAHSVDDVQSVWLSDHALYISDFDGQVFKRMLNSESTEYQRMPTLNGHSLVLYKQHFYSYDIKSGYLTQYDLNGEFIKKLKPLKPFAWKVSDIKGNYVLLDQLIELNQDVVELSL